MPEHINIADLFEKHLFWDVRMEDLDLEYDKDFIIPRALFATGAETFDADITKLENLYPRAVILMELQQTDERISNEVCELVAKRYEVPIFYRWKYKDDKRVDVSQIFPNNVFWDADPTNLDVDRDLGYIIPRALFATDENNFEENILKLEDLYPRETILLTLQHTRESISNKVCELVAQRYEVEPFYRWKIT